MAFIRVNRVRKPQIERIAMFFSKLSSHSLVCFGVMASLIIFGAAQNVAKSQESQVIIESDLPDAEIKNKKTSDNAGAVANSDAEKVTKEELEKNLSRLDYLYVPIHWSDYSTGLAIGGFDPIAYFETAKATFGDEEFQLVWHGVSWQFISEGNMNAFKRTPSVYAPQYAGYDPYAISNNILAEGQPSLWSIINGRLYLFHSEVNRYLWQENIKTLKRKTEKNWSRLSLDLPRFNVSGK